MARAVILTVAARAQSGDNAARAYNRADNDSGKTMSTEHQGARANRTGILMMVAAMATFIVNDTIVKHVSASLPTAQLIFVRGLMATVLVLLVARSMGATIRLGEMARGWVAARALLDAVATMLYLVALFQMPIANATAINLASPLFLTVLAAIFLREAVGAHRWIATLVGFAGVLLVIQPRADGFNAAALVCLLATAIHSARDLLTRRIAAHLPGIIVTLATTVAVTLLALLVSFFEGWQAMSWSQVAWLVLAAAFLATGHYAVIAAMRHGELSLVAPFRYTALLWALVLGYLVWGNLPGPMARVGIVLMIGAGLYVLHRERVRGVGPRGAAIRR